ncbi:retrovirus-related pol polyprotein from transposon TNT 1-94 [Tanacetum coccineum]
MLRRLGTQSIIGDQQCYRYSRSSSLVMTVLGTIRCSRERPVARIVGYVWLSVGKALLSQGFTTCLEIVSEGDDRFLKIKDEAPAAIIKCIKNIQVHLNATVQNVRTDNGTEFVNQTLREWYEKVDITHQTSIARTPQQNGVVERRNQTLVEATQTMLIFSKDPLFL